LQPTVPQEGELSLEAQVVLLSFLFQRECAFGGVRAIFNEPLEEQPKTQQKLLATSKRFTSSLISESGS